MTSATVCMTYFKSLALANLDAALYSLRRQDLSRVDKIVLVDNDTDSDPRQVAELLAAFRFEVPASLIAARHGGDPSKTHPWSSNLAVSEATAPWVFFTRADYILDFGALAKFVAVTEERPRAWDGFVTGNVYHLSVDVSRCEMEPWRSQGARLLRALPGAEESYTLIDTGVWMARRESYDRVGGLDEGLSAWGHAQTHFQHKLHKSGVEFVRIPEPLFYHPQHAAPRDINAAHRQLAARGLDIHEMWERHDGPKPYTRIN